MPLTLLIPLVVLGIAGVTLVLHLLGLTAPARLSDEQAARRAWLREFPNAPPTAITLCQSGRAALIETAQGPGIVWTMGADTTARTLHGAQLQPTAKGLRIDLPDFTAPHLTLTLAPTEARIWTQKLEPQP